MNDSRQQIKDEIKKLDKDAINILESMNLSSARTEKGNRHVNTLNALRPLAYQSWYTKALPIIRQLLPDRYQEFQELYKIDKRKEIDASTYTISDYFSGIRIPRMGIGNEEADAIFSTKFLFQLSMLRSASERLDSILSDIRGVLQAEFFDDELSAAEELLKKNHLRAAGTLAGVTLERHLATVLTNHNLKLAKKSPTIADLNNELKTQGVYDVPDWRFIERLGDIRNYCAHSKEREPTKVEVSEMIEGVKKVIKTIF